MWRWLLAGCSLAGSCGWRLWLGWQLLGMFGRCQADWAWVWAGGGMQCGGCGSAAFRTLGGSCAMGSMCGSGSCVVGSSTGAVGERRRREHAGISAL